MDKQPRSNWSRKIAITLAVLAIGYVGGVFAKRLQPKTSEQPTLDAPTTTTKGRAPKHASAANSLAPLTAEQSIQQLTSWANSPDALAQQFLLYDAIGRAAPEAFLSICLSLQQKDDEPTLEARAVLHLRWRTVDPESLLRFRHLHADTFKPSYYYHLSTILTRLIEKSLPRTVNLLQELETSGAKLAPEYRILFQIVSKIPSSSETAHAIAFAKEKATLLGIELAAELHQNQPEATLPNILAALDDNPNQAYKLFPQLVSNDVESALELALSIEDSNTRNRFLQQSVGAYAKKHPHQSIWLLDEFFVPGNQASMQQLETLIAAALNEDPTAAQTWNENAKTKEQLTKFLQASNTSQASLLPLFALQPDSNWKREKIRKSVRALGYHDFAAAESWISANLSPEAAIQSRLDLITQSFTHDQQAALEMLDRSPRSASREQAIRQLSQHWANTDLDAALSWAMKQDNPEDESIAIGALAQHWVAADSEAAKRYAATSLDQQTQNTFREAIFRHLQTYQSPEAALAYVADSNLPADQNHNLSQAISNLAAEDPHAAFQLIINDPKLDGDIHVLAQIWAQLDPAAATSTLLGQGGEIATRSIEPLVDSYVKFDLAGLQKLADRIHGPNQREAFYRAIHSNGNLRQHNPQIFETLVSEFAP